MFSLKTGALIHASIMSAVDLAEDADPATAANLDAFARRIGVAFQIKDDLLDIEGETEVIGKPAGSDEEMHKSTYPSVTGIEAARARCTELLEEGMQHLGAFGDRAAALSWLARYIVTREM